MIVVSDTSVVSALIQIGKVDLLNDVATVIRELREQASFWISADLEEKVLADAGED